MSECLVVKVWVYIDHFPLHDIYLAVSLILLLTPFVTFMSASTPSEIPVNSLRAKTYFAYFKF